MHDTAPRVRSIGVVRWTGYVLSALPILFLLFDSSLKILKPQMVTEAMKPLGYSDDLARPLGFLLLACVILYAIPWTAVLGAILLTGYLGGAVATHVRVGDPLVTHVLFPVYLGFFIWAGLLLRDVRIKAILPIRWRLRHS